MVVSCKWNENDDTNASGVVQGTNQQPNATSTVASPFVARSGPGPRAARPGNFLPRAGRSRWALKLVDRWRRHTGRGEHRPLPSHPNSHVATKSTAKCVARVLHRDNGETVLINYIESRIYSSTEPTDTIHASTDSFYGGVKAEMQETSDIVSAAVCCQTVNTACEIDRNAVCGWHIASSFCRNTVGDQKKRFPIGNQCTQLGCYTGVFDVVKGHMIIGWTP